ncbi:hypothetical protein HK101_000236 [Irineochytrium annulatum]|nr:hypothetical protein HK101_000236 [Irineochytrium annulatum]
MVQNQGSLPVPALAGAPKAPPSGPSSHLPASKSPSPARKGEDSLIRPPNPASLGTETPLILSLEDLRGEHPPVAAIVSAPPSFPQRLSSKLWEHELSKPGADRPEVEESRREPMMVSVDDFTDWAAFFALLETTIWATVDSVLWSILNSMIAVVFIAVLPFFYLFHNLRAASLSRAAAGTDGNSFGFAMDGKKAKVILQKLNVAPKKFDYDLAEFFLCLSTVAYAPTDEVKRFIDMWKTDHIRDLNYGRYGQEGCCFLALWSVEANFVIFSFKGTSAYDLTEWLTDASMRKGPPRNGMLPGLVHTGFYNSFGFPKSDIVDVEQLGVDRLFEESLLYNGKRPIPYDAFAGDQFHDQGGRERCPRSHGSDPEFWKNTFYPQILQIRSYFPQQQRPKLWVTGHSLGAAAAIYFTLRGAYTFGTPRVGDREFQEKISKVMGHTYSRDGREFKIYRVVNANDIVCSVPGISRGIGGFLHRVKRVPFACKLADGTTAEDHDRPGGVTLSDFEHIGEEVLLGFRDGSIRLKDRSVLDVVRTGGSEVIRAFGDLVFAGRNAGDRMVASATILSWGWAGLVRDHLAGEYSANLAAARKKRPRGPRVV